MKEKESGEGTIQDMSQVDPEFKEEVAREPGGANLVRCFACGTCAAGCPVREVHAAYNPRTIIRKALAGLREEVLSSDEIWLCSTCYTCLDRCPQGVGFTEALTAIRNIAAREGRAPSGFTMQAQMVGDFGRLYEVEDFDNKKRKKKGLPAVEKKIETVTDILRHVGVFEMLEKERSEEQD